MNTTFTSIPLESVKIEEKLEGFQQYTPEKNKALSDDDRLVIEVPKSDDPFTFHKAIEDEKIVTTKSAIVALSDADEKKSLWKKFVDWFNCEPTPI